MTGPEPTEREMEVAALVAEGLTNKEIAERLRLNVGTVSTHIRNARAKHGLRNRTELGVWFVRTYERTSDGG